VAREGGTHREVGGVVSLALALGDGVEDDGGEVGHQVRRLPAQRRQIPHPGLSPRRPRAGEKSLRSGESESDHHARAPPPAAAGVEKSRERSRLPVRGKESGGERWMRRVRCAACACDGVMASWGLGLDPCT